MIIFFQPQNAVHSQLSVAEVSWAQMRTNPANSACSLCAQSADVCTWCAVLKLHAAGSFSFYETRMSQMQEVAAITWEHFLIFLLAVYCLPSPMEEVQKCQWEGWIVGQFKH